jgi:hypothetical protein
MPSPDQALRHLPKHQLHETELVNLHVGSWIEVLPIALGKADTPRVAAVLDADGRAEARGLPRADVVVLYATGRSGFCG